MLDSLGPSPFPLIVRGWRGKDRLDCAGSAEFETSSLVELSNGNAMLRISLTMYGHFLASRP